MASPITSPISYEMPPTPVTNDEYDDGEHPSHDNCHHGDNVGPTISKVSATSKAAAQAVAPFLARHIPDQYAPQGGSTAIVQSTNQSSPNTKFCYRHRPDLKCRRTADEPRMEGLQKDLEALSQRDQQAISHVWSVFSAAPPRHRELLLQGLLTQCCFPQLSYLSSAVRDLIRIDFISALPVEISFKILCYLDSTSLCKAAQVSRRWRELSDDDQVWHLICSQHIDKKCTKCGWGLPLLERRRLQEFKREQSRGVGRANEWTPIVIPALDEAATPGSLVVSSGGKRSAEDDSISGSEKRQRTTKPEDVGEVSFKPKSYRRPWKDVYKDRFKVGTNWKYGRHSMKAFKAHDNGVMCLQFDDQILATGSYDSTIRIWNIETGELIRTLKGHTSGVRALQFDDSKLISGSLDRTIRIWNWRTGECKTVLQPHDDGVISVHFENDTLVSGSIDKTIKVFNFKDKSVFCLRGHSDWVNQVKVDIASRTVFSASDDGTAKLWDLDTKQCIRTFKGHVGQVQQILPLPAEFEPEEEDGAVDDDAVSVSSMDTVETTTQEGVRANYGPGFNNPCPTSQNRQLPPRYALTGSLDATIRLWDVSSGRCIKKFFGHVEGIWALAADTLRVVSGAEDRMVKIWDTRTGKCGRTFTGHMGPVNCIALSDSKMVTGSEDCEVRIYSFRANEEECTSVVVNTSEYPRDVPVGSL